MRPPPPWAIICRAAACEQSSTPFALTSISASHVRSLVDRDRDDQHGALYDVRVEGVDAERDEAAVDHAEERHGDDHAADAALAAVEGDAAEDHRGDHVELEADAEARVRGAVAA